MLVDGVAAALTAGVIFLPSQFRGFTAGVWLTSVAWMTVSWITIASGAGTRLMGESGEQWTAQTLRGLRQRGWRVANHADVVGRGDIDHLAIGPGGLVVVETKWTSRRVDLATDSTSFNAAAKTVAERARRLGIMLTPQLRSAPVYAVVVVWGPEVVGDAQHPAAGTTTVLAGAHLETWLNELLDAEVSQPAIDAAWKRVDKEVARGDTRETSRSQHPTPISQSVFKLWTGVVGGFAGVLALGWLIPLVDGSLDKALAAVGVISVGVVARRVAALRVFAIGWLAGVCGSALLAVGYAVYISLV